MYAMTTITTTMTANIIKNAVQLMLPLPPPLSFYLYLYLRGSGADNSSIEALQGHSYDPIGPLKF